MAKEIVEVASVTAALSASKNYMERNGFEPGQFLLTQAVYTQLCKELDNDGTLAFYGGVCIHVQSDQTETLSHLHSVPFEGKRKCIPLDIDQLCLNEWHK